MRGLRGRRLRLRRALARQGSAKGGPASGWEALPAETTKAYAGDAAPSLERLGYGGVGPLGSLAGC